MNETLSHKLWRENRDLAERIYRHPFVQALGSGELPLQQFRAYIAQDAFFLEAFARAYALAMAHSPDREGLFTFYELLGGGLQELNLHSGYARKWGANIHDVTPMVATTAYTSFLLETAKSGDIGLICAAMTPCMRLYAFLGQRLAATYGIPDHDYADWIITYSDPEFEKLAIRLEGLLNQYGNNAQNTHHAYQRAMIMEYEFFDAHISSPGT